MKEKCHNPLPPSKTLFLTLNKTLGLKGKYIFNCKSKGNDVYFEQCLKFCTNKSYFFFYKLKSN